MSLLLMQIILDQKVDHKYLFNVYPFRKQSTKTIVVFCIAVINIQIIMECWLISGGGR